jgi:hypothetical protein
MCGKKAPRKGGSPFRQSERGRKTETVLRRRLSERIQGRLNLFIPRFRRARKGCAFQDGSTAGDTGAILGCVSKITKAQFRRLDLHILVEKPRRSTTAPVFFVSICKPIQQNCIFQTLETHPNRSKD